VSLVITEALNDIKAWVLAIQHIAINPLELDDDERDAALAVYVHQFHLSVERIETELDGKKKKHEIP